MNRLRRGLIDLMIRIQKRRPPGLDLLLLANAAVLAVVWTMRGVQVERYHRDLRVGGDAGLIEPLSVGDLADLRELLERVPPAERHFIPHGSGKRLLRAMLGMDTFLFLGLRRRGRRELLAYGLCRPTLFGKVLFLGYVSPPARGMGLGKDIILAAIAQARLTGQRLYSTLDVTNKASMTCVRAAGLSVRPLNETFYECFDEEKTP